MTKGRLQHTIDKYRSALRAHEAQAEHALEQAYAHALKTLEPALDKLYTQMIDAMANGEKIPLHWLVEAKRLENIKRLISNEIDHFGTLSRLQVQQAQQYAVQLGQKSALEMLHATLPPGVKYSFGTPNPAAIANMVGATQNGSPLADLFSGFGSEAADKAGQALITGITLGDNPRKVAYAVQDALGVSRQRALVISRQEMLQAYRSANMETYRANSDVVQGWIWQAALGGTHVCGMCVAMNGTEHPLDEEFASHVCCRCSPIPKTRSWSDILSGSGIDASGIDETSIEVQDGSEWFANQSDAAQLSILGSKAAYDLYKSGDASLQDFVGVKHDPVWGTSRYQKSAKQVANGGK